LSSIFATGVNWVTPITGKTCVTGRVESPAHPSNKQGKLFLAQSRRAFIAPGARIYNFSDHKFPGAEATTQPVCNVLRYKPAASRVAERREPPESVATGRRADELFFVSVPVPPS
jgi:hypothetical protein